jgi:hypothetical protein
MTMLVLLTWWSRGAADAAVPLARAALVAPASATVWMPRWLARDGVGESAAIACVGSGLIALGTFVRRTTGTSRNG